MTTTEASERIEIPRQDGMFGGIGDNLYHADKGSLSVSGAKLLLPPSCPEKFREYRDNPPPPKPEFDFGHLAHKLVLGEGAEIVTLDPAVHGLKKDGTVADSPAATTKWKAAAAEARERGATPVHVDDYRVAEAMAERVRRDREAAPLFVEGYAEQSFYHTDEVTGVRLRGRTDWLTVTEMAGRERLVIVDYKTSVTANPEELRWKFYSYGYYMQAAWYIDIVTAIGLSEDPAFRFVVQEKKSPYVVSVIKYDDEAIEEGRRRNRQAIELYARCRDANDWPAYADTTVTISLPARAMRAGIATDADALIAELEGISA